VDAVLVLARALGRRHLHEHQRHRAGQFFQLRDVGGGAQRVGMEGGQVLADALGTVALRIDGDEQHPRPDRLGNVLQLALGLGQFGQGHRAYVRAEGEADEHHGPVPVQFAGHQLGAVGLAQGEVGQLARLREQGDGAGFRLSLGRGRGEDLLRGDQPQGGGERDDEHDQRGAIEHFPVRFGCAHDNRAADILPGPLAPPGGAAMTDELRTIIDLIRYGASRFNAAGLTFGHSYDNALDEATQLTLHALHLPHDLSPVYGQARVTLAEKEDVLGLFLRRIEERVPAAYLTGEAWFAGLSFRSDPRALVPRSPIAEMILGGFEPWLGGREVRRALDLCTGSGCIAIAMAHHNPDWHVDGADLSPDALDLARENAQRLGVDNVRFLQSDLFSGLQGEHYDLIVTNPPYVTNDETAALPREYSHEPELGLRAGEDGLDLALRILRDAPLHLREDGLLVCEVGEAERALTALLPDLPLAWVEFKVGQMGVFVADRRDLVAHNARISLLAQVREGAAAVPAAAGAGSLF